MTSKTYGLYSMRLTNKFLDLIKTAKKQITIINPFINDNNIIKDLIHRSKKIKIEIYTSPKTDITVSSEIQVNYIDKLHAKILLIDYHKCLISSMNITRTSLLENFEFGIYSEDKQIIKRVVSFIKELSSQPITAK